MKAFEFAIIALVLVCAGLAVTFYLTDNAKSGAVVVPTEFAEKSGTVEAVEQAGGRAEDGGLVGRAYDSALFSAEKAVLSPSEKRSGVSGMALLFIALVIISCVFVWVRSR